MQMATPERDMFLLEAVKTLKFPMKIQLLENLESMNTDQCLHKGEIINIYGCGQQLLITGSDKCEETSETVYANVNVSEGEKEEEYTPMVQPRLIYIPVNCGEKLKDIHCDGKTFIDFETLIKQTPHFVRAKKDFFAMYVDEKKGTAKINEGTILEFVRIVDQGDPEAYRNCRKEGDKDLLIYKLDGEEIVLNTLLQPLTCVSDPNEYSVNSFLNNFPFPRKMQYAKSDLQELFEQLTDTSYPIIQDQTDNCRFFFSTKDIKSMANDFRKISLFEHVSMLCIDERKKSSRVKVTVLSDGSTQKPGDNFKLYFAKETGKKDGPFKTFDLYGRNVPLEATKAANSKETIRKHEEDSTEDQKQSLKRKGTKQPVNYETIYPITKSSAHDELGHDQKTSTVQEKTPSADDKTEYHHKSGSLPNIGHLHFTASGTNQTDIDKSHDQSHGDYGPQFQKVDNKFTRSKSVPVKVHPTKSPPIPPLPFPKSPINKTNQCQRQTLTITEEDLTHPHQEENASANIHENIQESENASANIHENIQESENASTNIQQNIQESVSIESMSVPQLSECMEFCGLRNLAETLKEERIDGQYFIGLSDEELKDEPYCLKSHQIKKIQKIKDGWRPKV